MSERVTPDITAALAALAAALQRVGQPSMVIGGVAVIARGVPRLTVDIDAVVLAEKLDLDLLWRELACLGFEARIPNAAEFARQRQILLLTHPASGMPVDLSLGWMTFEKEAMARATPLTLGGVTLPIATAEDLVVFKAIAWRDLDKSDIRELVVRHGDQMSFERIRLTLSQLFEILEVPERMAQLDALIRKALSDADQA